MTLKKKQLIECQSLWKIFGQKAKTAMQAVKERNLTKEQVHNEFDCIVGVQNATFSVDEGEIFCIMGLSGSGKSTLIRHINRLIEPTSGEIFIDGENINNLNQTELREIRSSKSDSHTSGSSSFAHDSSGSIRSSMPPIARPATPRTSALKSAAIPRTPMKIAPPFNHQGDGSAGASLGTRSASATAYGAGRPSKMCQSMYRISSLSSERIIVCMHCLDGLTMKPRLRNLLPRLILCLRCALSAKQTTTSQVCLPAQAASVVTKELPFLSALHVWQSGQLRPNCADSIEMLPLAHASFAMWPSAAAGIVSLTGCA